jgi:antitoxin MazE
MKTVVQKWGKSVALRIPKGYAAGAGLVPGAEVEVSLHQETLVVTPVRRRVHSLKNFLRQITPGNLQPAVDAGGPVGRETI